MNLENITKTTGGFEVRNLRIDGDIIYGDIFDLLWRETTWFLSGSYYLGGKHRYDLDLSTTPTHYKNAGKDDVIAFCVKNKLGFIEGNIIKYVTRYKAKNGLEDLQKAQEYLNRLIQTYEKDQAD